MASITSTKSGNWSDSTVWSGTIANNDTVTVTAGHTVTFDASMSALTNGVTLVINGILRVSESAGAYLLKISTTISFGANGVLEVGTSEAVPYPSLNCTFGVQMTNASSHSIVLPSDATAHVKMYGQVPTGGLCFVTQAYTINSTMTVTVDRNLSGFAASEGYWKAGQYAQVTRIWAGAVQTSELIISSVSSNSITFTSLVPLTIDAPSAVGAETVYGAVITLNSRNVTIEGLKTSGNHRAVSGTPTAVGNVLNGVAVRGCYYTNVSSHVVSFDKSILINLNVAINVQSGGMVVSHIIMVNCSQGFTSSFNSQLLHCTFIASGTAGISGVYNRGIQAYQCNFYGNNNSVQYGYNIVLDACKIWGATYGLIYVFGVLAKNCTFAKLYTGFYMTINTRLQSCVVSRGGLYDVYGNDLSSIISIDTTNLGVNSHTYANTSTPTANYIRQINTVADTDVAQGRSGTRTKFTSGLPAGYSEGYSYLYADTAQPMYFDEPVRVDDLPLHFRMALKQSAVLSTPLKVQLFAAQNDPLLGGTADYEVSLTSGAVDTWEEKTIDVTLPAGEYTLRVIFGHTSAGVTAYVAVRQAPETDTAIEFTITETESIVFEVSA